MAALQTWGMSVGTFVKGMYQRDDNRLTARSRFRQRHLRNWCKAICIFAAVALVFALCIPSLEWFGDIAAGIVLWHLLFHVWDKEPVWIRCNQCAKLIETNVTWICGFKQCRNEAIDEFPFVHRCQHCGAEPKAYECHHCGKLIFLTDDELRQNYARCSRPFKERSDLDIPGLEHDLHKAGLELSIAGVDKQMAGLNPNPKPRDDIERQRAEALRDIEYETQKSKLNGLREQEAATERRAREANLPLEERLQKKHDREFAAADACRKGRKLAEEMFKDDPQRLKQERRWWKNQEDELSI
jgi:hypothetical protein